MTKNSPIRSRRSIHDNIRDFHSDDSDIEEEENVSDLLDNTQSEDDLIEQQIKSQKRDIKHSEKQNYSYLSIFLIVVLSFSVFFFIALYNYGNDNNENPMNPIDKSLEILRKQFPKQNTDFWISIQVTLDDINNYNQTSSIILVHKTNNEKILLEKISEYASMKILNRVADPFILDGVNLNKANYSKDYGALIEDIRRGIPEKAVVIVKNVEKVPSAVAQAFHQLCDQYNPIKRNMLYIFTIKAHGNTSKLNQFVEKLLRTNWSSMHNDRFHALFTRLSTFILPIN